MRKIGLLCLFSLVTIASFAAFPIETQVFLSEIEPEKFRFDTLGFIIGILTIPLFIFFLPLLLLFIDKKNFRKSLALGWLAGLVLIVLISIAAQSDFKLLY